jgi:alpha-mannosidase
VENGPVCAVIRCAKQIGKACFTQDIILYTHTRRIDFRTCGDWQEREALLKVAFAVQVRASHATYEIAYGAAERSTHANTSWERAQFEVSGHKWADLSEGNYGVSLLNDCKYGYDIRDNLMRLTLLRAPVFPDPHADVGYHEFTYALYPHEGSWREGGTVKEAYSLNQPFVAIQTQRNADDGIGDLALQQGMVASSADNVVVEVVKAAEDQPDSFIVRAFEAYGQRGCVNLTFLRTLVAATECDLLERSIQPVEHTRSVLSFSIKPFEIRSFKIRFC